MAQIDQGQPDSHLNETTVEPIPPRYWWLKRIGVAVGVLLVALFALRVWWGWEANRRLQAEIDRIVAAGEPIYPEDFDPKEDIPDDQNAASLLIKASEAMNLTPEQQSLLVELAGEPELIKVRLEEVRGIVESGAEALALVRRARGLHDCDWGVRMRTPAINTLLPNLSGQRNLAKLMYVAARYAHLTGNNEEAVEILRDALAQSKRLYLQPSLIGLLVAIACEALVTRTMEEILPRLRITPDEESSSGGTKMATRSQISGMLLGFLDELPMREGMRLAMFSERMSQVDVVRGLGKGSVGVSSATPWAAAWNYLITPLVQLDGATMIGDSNLRLQAAGEPDWVRAQRLLPEEPTHSDTLGEIVHFLSRILVPSLERVFLLHFRSLAERRLAGAALAIRLYEVDHGRRPRTLAELVPDYLPEIPLDPFAGDGTTIRYLPDGSRALLYSVGSDGVDDDGKYAFKSERIDLDRLDMPFFLDGNRPTRAEDDIKEEATSVSTQADDNQIEAEDEEGEGDEDETGEQEP